jgi:hypothetical protein
MDYLKPSACAHYSKMLGCTDQCIALNIRRARAAAAGAGRGDCCSSRRRRECSTHRPRSGVASRPTPDYASFLARGTTNWIELYDLFSSLTSNSPHSYNSHVRTCSIDNCVTCFYCRSAPSFSSKSEVPIFQVGCLSPGNGARMSHDPIQIMNENSTCSGVDLAAVSCN